jgi:hypothetical protein
MQLCAKLMEKFMSKEDSQLGYDFEDELKKIFKGMQEKYPFYWHQFPDSKAARGFIASQPSDFLVKGLKTRVMLFEAKASVKKKSLAACAKSAILPAQIGHHKKYHRAGGDTLFIFYGELENRVELWDGKYVTNCISSGGRMNVLGGEFLLASCDYFELETMLINYFCKG